MDSKLTVNVNSVLARSATAAPCISKRWLRSGRGSGVLQTFFATVPALQGTVLMRGKCECAFAAPCVVIRRSCRCCLISGRHLGVHGVMRRDSMAGWGQIRVAGGVSSVRHPGVRLNLMRSVQVVVVVMTIVGVVAVRLETVQRVVCSIWLWILLRKQCGNLNYQRLNTLCLGQLNARVWELKHSLF